MTHADSKVKNENKATVVLIRKAARQIRGREITNDFKITCSATETSKKFGMSAERVRQIVNANGINPKTFRREAAKAHSQKLLDTVKGNLFITTKLPVKVIQKIRYDLGIKFQKIKEENIIKESVKLNELGVGRVKIGNKINFNYRTISKYLAQGGRPVGCTRGTATKERDAQLYKDWKEINKTNKKHSIALVGKQYDMSPVNALYCLRRHLFNDIKSNQKIK